MLAHAAPSVEDFARLPTFADLDISPGGTFLAARMNRNNTYGVVVIDISERSLRKVYEFTESDEISVAWFRWVSPEHLLTSVKFTGVRGTGVAGVRTEERRLVSLNATTVKHFELFRHKRSGVPIQIQDEVVSYLPDDPAHILVQYSRENLSQPHVYKINFTKRANHRRVARGRRGVLDWMVDRQGQIRLGQGITDRKYRYLTIRPVGKNKWIDFSHRVSEPGVDFRPIAFSGDSNKVYVASNHEGDTTGLYLFDIDADKFDDVIFRHPTVDIASVAIDERTGELRSINFIEKDVATRYFARRPIEIDIRNMGGQFPGMDISTISISTDNNYAVLKIQAANDPGTYYLYDRTAPRFRQLPGQYPGLEDHTLGNTIATSYQARDGLDIPAFITLPFGLGNLSATEKIPFIVLPHGGPGARDFLGFDYWTQFLVSRGYGVIQMNFRGSTGYGRAFKDAGNREWGQAMQDDITDGVHWLVKNGYADPDRIAILGASYGGYAALMGAVKTPGLYQCAISFAGVSNLVKLLKLQRKFVAGGFSTRFIGDLWKDREMLKENSPALRAEEIMVPILLLHGDSDVVVDADQSEEMARALRKHDKEFQFVLLEKGNHHLSLYTNRHRFLAETKKFLADCLGRQKGDPSQSHQRPQ